MQKQEKSNIRKNKKENMDHARKRAGRQALAAMTKKKKGGRKKDGSHGNRIQRAENGPKRRSGRNTKGRTQTGLKRTGEATDWTGNLMCINTRAQGEREQVWETEWPSGHMIDGRHSAW